MSKEIKLMAREILDFITFNCTPETADRLLAELEKLGITASFATPDEAEVLYLLKTAYILNEDTTPAWKKVIKKLDKEMASSSERVKALRQYWSDRLGVDDVTKIAGYDPQGRYSLMTSSWKGKREAGWRKQLRFDITDTQIERELKGYGLYHRLTDGSDLPEVLDAVLEHNGAMVSTVEKMRIGIPVGGMSPGSDMESGGASYFFTRIRKLPEKDGYGESGLYLKPHLLRRMDAIIPAFAGTGFMTTMNMDGLQATMCGNIVKSDLRITNGLPGARVLMRLYSRTRSHCWTI